MSIVRKSGLSLVSAILLFSFLCISVSYSQEMPKVSSKKWTDKYDGHFRKYSKRFFGVGFDWKWIKAQAIAESSLKEDAQSWASAKGIMQIVPATFAEIKEKNPDFVDIQDPRWNIAAGVYYDYQLYKRWTDIDTSLDRLSFMFASYNAGRRTILNAQRLSKSEGFDGNRWPHIEVVAPRVRRWRHTETLGYINRIFYLMDKKEKK
ncbi:MAG: transglycosylase SLT domain-containing protein [bacterium]|nr:transglycosylase SLT domain-containing protein [bacterium]